MRAAQLLRLLPRSFQADVDADGDPTGMLGGLLAVMEVLHERPEHVLGRLDTWFDPLTAPEAFVAYLASWVDLEWLLLEDPESGTRVPLPGGATRLRHLLVEASALSAERGTARALVRFLALAGVPGAFVEDAAGTAFHCVLRVPAQSQQYDALVRRVVEHSKPAHVNVEVRYDEGVG